MCVQCSSGGPGSPHPRLPAGPPKIYYSKRTIYFLKDYLKRAVSNAIHNK